MDEPALRREDVAKRLARSALFSHTSFEHVRDESEEPNGRW